LANNTLKVQQITPNVYAIVGELTNRSPENLGNNATFGVVVTDEGVVLIDSGGSYLGAKAIAKTIKTITDKPIIKVINTGGQDHRFLGNSYFKAQGAQIIANQRAVADQKERLDSQLARLESLIGKENLTSTTAVYADTTFDKEYKFKLGGTKFEIYHSGQAHTPGDSYVYLPKQHIIFTGDIVYLQRMLGVRSYSHSGSWIKVFEQIAQHKPKHIVPGHGSAADLTTAKQDTYNYLVLLRQKVAEFMENDGDMADISTIDLSKFKYLFNFDNLSGANTQQVYSELEWE
jgi:glyoxylase-like metal-dependent hydrolase (beta-lactamase superfamily II)